MQQRTDTSADRQTTREELVKRLQDDRVLAYNSMFLGVFMLLFGFLKFFEPFRTMFDVQIAKSELPPISIPFGKVAEMAIGLGLLLPACFRQKIVDLYGPVVFAASAGLVVNMAVATYVHLQPDVPANVLPLGIKPPFIPLFVMALAALNVYRLCGGRRSRSQTARQAN
ncbi:DoxX family protein [Mycolicibacterium aichiense]|uniref:DoxX family protein n=1 Tax=Mycolicibacterium aichiense TaxID=1799 RepID=UPI003D67ABDB